MFCQNRFIPTHVGNRKPADAETPRPAVHPHACGEQLLSCTKFLFMYGSSPRMWGTVRRAASHRAVSRFIPTHVGNRPSVKTSLVISAVHPHACGEQRRYKFALSFSNGSSPRMWGTGYAAYAFMNTVRFIPTHVGNSCVSEGCHAMNSVHPHACGEQ